jgi:hypothetical protein
MANSNEVYNTRYVLKIPKEDAALYRKLKIDGKWMAERMRKAFKEALEYTIEYKKQKRAERYTHSAVMSTPSVDNVPIPTQGLSTIKNVSNNEPNDLLVKEEIEGLVVLKKQEGEP